MLCKTKINKEYATIKEIQTEIKEFERNLKILKKLHFINGIYLTFQ